MKIKAQTNPEYRTISMSQVFKQEGMNLYAGWQWTMARNVPGSFALFGANALTKELLHIGKNGEKPTFLQTSICSLVGSVTSIIVACPLDVVKTRIQSGTFGQVGGFTVIKRIVKEEGMGAFFKGAIPKVCCRSRLSRVRVNKHNTQTLHRLPSLAPSLSSPSRLRST